MLEKTPSIFWIGRELGIRDDIIFETNGLVLHEDKKRVLLCLLEVSHYTKKVHIKPPDIISMEQESEAEGEEMINPVVHEVASVEMKVDDDVSKGSISTVLQPPQTNEPSGDQTLAYVNMSEGCFALLEYFCIQSCSFFLLLLLILGGGLYYLRRK